MAVGIIVLASSASARADNHDHTPPGNPCAKNNGNPCNGNNGNAGEQGNAHHAAPVTVDVPTPPPFSGRGAYVTQIGDVNDARITQSAPNAYASIRQTGNANASSIDQRGEGDAFADVRQTGDYNQSTASQDGLGPSVLYLTQTGNHNIATAGQAGTGATGNGAVLAQTGNGNDIALAQNGDGNLANLAQNGDDNTMTATQNGDNNSLAWTQTGNGLRDLGITQNGGQALQVTQTK